MSLQESILIVDDQNTMRRIISGMLHKLGYRKLDEAIDGTEALAKINNNHYDIIISDWNMEPMNGIEFLKKLRTNDNYKDTPFLMVTAESKKENVVEALNAGVSNYIVKPFNAQTLKTKIASVQK